MKPAKHRRSITKSVIWRIMGIAILALITYIYTRSFIQSGLITFFHHFAFVIIYYLHERAWLMIDTIKGKLRRGLRAVTYEIILGHCVLGLITVLITGSWLKVTLITITYIENKLWIYVVYDWIWGKIRWGQLIV